MLFISREIIHLLWLLLSKPSLIMFCSWVSNNKRRSLRSGLSSSSQLSIWEINYFVNSEKSEDSWSAIKRAYKSSLLIFNPSIPCLVATSNRVNPKLNTSHLNGSCN